MSADMAGSAMFESRYTPVLIRTSIWWVPTPACSMHLLAASDACSIELRMRGSVLTAVARMAVPMSHLEGRDGGGQAPGDDPGRRRDEQELRALLHPPALQVLVQHEEVRGRRRVPVLVDHGQGLRHRRAEDGLTEPGDL